jgi:hypothetical protein
MTHSNTRNRFIARNFPHYGTPDFTRRMEEGLKRAPEERAIALKEFWGWFTRT